MVSKYMLVFIYFFVACALGGASEEENVSFLSTNTSNVTFEPISFFASSNTTMNATPLAPQLEVFKLVPDMFHAGDMQFSILFVNNGTAPLYTSSVGVYYPGFASYSVSVLEELAPGAKGFVLLSGRFEKAGEGNLTINVNSDTFILPITVVAATGGIVKSEEVLEAQLGNVSVHLREVKQRYILLERDLAMKGKERYAIDSLSLDDAKAYLRDAEAALIRREPLEAQAGLALAEDELALRALQLSVVEKKSLLDSLKENAVLFSTLGGALVMFFTLYELLKKKSAGAVETVKQKLVKKE
ncbi:hypothetical protein EXS73_02485 [Candidatus Pacearchaeota archaeon]|nr:hypothetical protein [Candidatus Pacearchaeota archaeon]